MTTRRPNRSPYCTIAMITMVQYGHPIVFPWGARVIQLTGDFGRFYGFYGQEQGPDRLPDCGDPVHETWTIGYLRQWPCQTDPEDGTRQWLSGLRWCLIRCTNRVRSGRVPQQTASLREGPGPVGNQNPDPTERQRTSCQWAWPSHHRPRTQLRDLSQVCLTFGFPDGLSGCHTLEPSGKTGVRLRLIHPRLHLFIGDFYTVV